MLMQKSIASSNIGPADASAFRGLEPSPNIFRNFPHFPQFQNPCFGLFHICVPPSICVNPRGMKIHILLGVFFEVILEECQKQIMSK
jgi:hypothetical protein